MFGFVLAVVLGLVLYLIAARFGRGPARTSIMQIVMAGYVARLILQTFLREIPFFTHGVGGDYGQYEAWAQNIVLIWEHTGFEYITQDQLWAIGQTDLPQNVFALVFWLNGSPTRMGCTAVVAFAACLTCFNLCVLALEHGADDRFAKRILALTLFGPAFLMYTSELYKDGLVALFVTGAIGSAFRLARRFSVVHSVIGIVCLLALWHVRYYLIFVTVVPLVVGVAGINTKSITRPVIAALLFAALGLFLVTYTGVLSRTEEAFGHTVEVGTNPLALNDNATGGSGVTFDDGGNPFGALPLKIAYTLLSPFPWQLGSLGLQVGKIDAFVWYYILYRALKAARDYYHTNKRFLLMVLSFVAPTTLVYATTMSNVGLVVRERLPIVLFMAFVGALSVRREETEGAEEAPELDEERDAALAEEA